MFLHHFFNFNENISLKKEYYIYNFSLIPIPIKHYYYLKKREI
jgi:hypothetical protein